jgi:2-hydroxyglutarate dehydrogenase
MGTRVVRIDRDPEGKGWIVQMETGWSEDGEKGQVESVKCQVVVNAAGLGAASLLEGIVPEQDQPKMYLVKGMFHPAH